MAILTVPTSPDDPFYTQSTVLDGTTYVFTFRYNQRENEWYFGLALADGTSLVEGVKVICNRSLLSRFADVRLPPGTLLAYANTSDTTPPGIGELGEDRRVTLTYEEAGT